MKPPHAMISQRARSESEFGEFSEPPRWCRRLTAAWVLGSQHHHYVSQAIAVTRRFDPASE
jgi:hypothetical protein